MQIVEQFADGPAGEGLAELGGSGGGRLRDEGFESSQRLGRHRWVIGRTMSWLTGYRRRTIRYERDGGIYLAFLGLAAALCCYKRFIRLTT
ncbi:hypothetical protein ACIBH1_44620 [Nonomuraea sp. NPDC050663]|uniref:hypothetical protein n=1 Tax=Nonomuraea sp. NPDC050663 TaxID=3364370 RepID=UPI0037BD7785